MHASSFENMEKCYARYVRNGLLEQQETVRILDVGGSDVNGSYRDIFAHPRFAYTAVDLAVGPGVQLALEDPYKLPVDDRSIDIVLSGQMLEHCEFFWLSFAEMVRILKPGGYIFLIAPSSGPEHRYPVDCYRFYPDAYRALARYANCAVLDIWLDSRGPWKDLVGVFQRHPDPQPAEQKTEKIDVRPEDIVPGTEEEERIAGHVNYLNILGDLHGALRPQCYLEIGVRHGKSLVLAQGPAIGVDPQPELTVALADTTRIFMQTSDDFFDTSAATALTVPVDFAFIDGLHIFEAALRDFMHIEQLADPNGIIAIDDIYPNHPAQADRERHTRVWTGDVWKLLPVLRRFRPDLVMVSLDTAPSGCLLIAGLDPTNRTLWDLYNPIVREARGWSEPLADILSRDGAISPLSDAYHAFIAALIGGARSGALCQLAEASGI